MERLSDGVSKSTRHSLDEAKEKDLGGWTQTTYGENLFGPKPSDRCDIDEIVVRKGWKLANLRQAIQPYLQSSAPVVVRGGVSLLKGLRSSLTKESLIEEFGKRALSIGPIPYHENFQIAGTSLSLREYIEQVEQDAALIDGPDSPMYLFNRVRSLC